MDHSMIYILKTCFYYSRYSITMDSLESKEALLPNDYENTEDKVITIIFFLYNWGANHGN